MSRKEDSLEVMRSEVDRLYDENREITDALPRNKLHCGVSRNDGRNGVCKYNTRLTKTHFNKQITQTEQRDGHVSIVVNEKILEDGNRDGFIDTVRHELAHAIAYGMYEKYPSSKKHANYDPYYKAHGTAWKQLARNLGADPSSCHNKRDRSDEYKYYLGCPECGKQYGKTKRSKTIKQPFNRQCGRCDHHPLSSWDAGDEMPEEGGVVAVESIPWNNKREWRNR